MFIFRSWIVFRRNIRGSATIVFAYSILPAILVVSVAANLSMHMMVKAKLSAAADAAAIAAVSSTLLTTPPADVVPLAKSTFAATAGAITGASNIQVAVDVTDSGSKRTATVDYSANIDILLGNWLGAEASIQGTTVATNVKTTYIDFHLVLDNSPSMGIAGTTAGIATLSAKTGGCAFGCHIAGSTSDNYSIARNNNVLLRIDTLRLATQSLMDTARTARLVSDQFQMAIYSFGARADQFGLTKLQSLTSDMEAAKNGAASLDLMVLPYDGYRVNADTDFYAIFNSLNTEIATPGTGFSSSSRQKVLFFISDGVATRPVGTHPCTNHADSGQDPVTGEFWGRCIEPFNPQVCDGLKQRGVRIAVLYTTYLPLDGEPTYDAVAKPFQPLVAGKMRTCATNGLFFEVSPSQGTKEAMAALFAQVLGTATLVK